MSVHCTDPSVLETISSPQALVVRLLVTQAMGYDIWPELTLNKKIYLSDVDSVPAYRHLTLRLATAVWWPVPNDSKDTRELQGEIHLPPLLQPTIQLARFNYFVRFPGGKSIGNYLIVLT